MEERKKGKKVFLQNLQKREYVSSQNKASKSEVSKKNLGERIYFILFSLIAILIIAILLSVLFVLSNDLIMGVTIKNYLVK